MRHESFTCPGCGRLLQLTWCDGLAVPLVGLANCTCELTTERITALMAAVREQTTPKQETLL